MLDAYLTKMTEKQSYDEVNYKYLRDALKHYQISQNARRNEKN